MQKKPLNSLLVFMLIFGWNELIAQTKFDMNQLQLPEKYGALIGSNFKQKLVFEYKVATGKHAIFLKNGLRTAAFVNPQSWLSVKDSVYPYRIDIVYSRYPLIDGVYHEIYPLLFDRLRHLFELDEALNDEDFTWNTVLQTHCDSDAQVNTMFHGIVIWYRTAAEEMALNPEKDSTEDKLTTTTASTAVQGSYTELVKDLESVKTDESISDSLKIVLTSKPADEQTKILKLHFEQALKDRKPLRKNEITPLQLNLWERQIQAFLKQNPFADSVVWHVFDRHPEWKDISVVNDWTGSMYGYGAQVMNWHLKNFEYSPINFVTLFNDGDHKMSSQKKIGETGGIYTAESAEIPDIINLFNLVRLNGSGGDRQENDIEAILEAEKKYPQSKELVLIADNLACIRDIELASKINKPVKVVVCGYQKEFGINPHLIYLAKITNGSLHTLEEDFENLKVELSSNGELKSVKDKRFIKSILNCNYVDWFAKGIKEIIPVYTNIDSALRSPTAVKKLDLRSQQFNKIPSEISKFNQLFYLNLAENNLAQLPSSLKKLKNLKELDLSNNQLKKLPAALTAITGLEVLNISNNHFQHINSFLENCFYVRFFDASINQIENISNIALLKNAISINLSGNQISVLPDDINQLKRLKILDLSNNQLVKLPKNIIGLSKLEEFNLENNQLESLPKFLYRLRKLKVLNLTGNNLSEEEIARIRKELPLVQLII